MSTLETSRALRGTFQMLIRISGRDALARLLNIEGDRIRNRRGLAGGVLADWPVWRAAGGPAAALPLRGLAFSLALGSPVRRGVAALGLSGGGDANSRDCGSKRSSVNWPVAESIAATARTAQIKAACPNLKPIRGPNQTSDG